MENLKIIKEKIVSEEILRVQASLIKKGYAVTSDTALGFTPDLHKYIDERFFSDALLGPELPGFYHIDRMRARDVVEYNRKSENIVLSEYHDARSRPRGKITTPRAYNRTLVLEDEKMTNWITTFLSMIPVEEQKAQGTIGFDFLRTFNITTPFKHQDQEQFICIYIAARESEGAITSLYPFDEPEKLLFSIQLQPGEMLIFKDLDFWHDASPLIPRFEGDKPHRDALVVAIHNGNDFKQPLTDKFQKEIV